MAKKSKKHPDLPDDLSVREGAVLIIGGGMAGLFTALKLRPRPCIIVSATPFGRGSSSAWAQGGIAAAIAEGDSAEQHTQDTIDCGAGIVQEKMAALMAEEGADRVFDLLSFGVPFDQDLEGKLKLSREAAHSQRRIVRVKGDMAGRAIMDALCEAVHASPSIRLLEGYSARDLKVKKGKVTGIIAEKITDHEDNQPFFIPAGNIVLATGGMGQVYAVTTNPKLSRGDGVALAARAGAVIADAEFVQFHPTALNVGLDPAPLATEALRGEGATLIDSSGERFMQKIHDDGELAPRDIVARGVFREIARGGKVFLDCRKAVGKKFKNHFPKVFGYCEDAGIDPVTEALPVLPAAHYHMGGILVDANGRTSLNGVYACGEVTSTGVHGANRLASNSLLEAVVFAARIAEDINMTVPVPVSLEKRKMKVAKERDNPNQENNKRIQKLRNTMAQNVGVIRSEETILKALEDIVALEDKKHKSATLINMLAVAKLITIAALERKESRGAHFRSDFPASDESLAKRQYLTLKEANKITQQYLGKEHTKTTQHLRVVK